MIATIRTLARALLDALRRVSRRPRGAAFPIAILAVAIALSATVYSVVQGVWLRGLPVRGGDRFVFVSMEESLYAGTALEDVEALRREIAAGDSAFEAVVTNVALNFMLTGQGRGTVSRTGAYVSADLFEVLGVEAAHGRALVPADMDPASPPVSVIGHAFWQSYFGGEEVLGQPLVINRAPTTIVGIMPPGFGFPYRQELWTVHRQADMPWAADTAGVSGRLRPGASVEQARSELELLAARLDAERPRDAPRVAKVTPFLEEVVEPTTRRALGILLVAVAGVLVVACANAANLQLASSLDRRGELAVRAALGAGRGRLATLLLAETVLIVAVSSVLGLALAWVLVERVGRALLQGSLLRGFWMDIRLDASVVAVTLAVAAVVALLVGLAPAWLATGRRSGIELRSGARVQRATSRIFVAVQVGLCFALVVAAGALGRNALGLLSLEPGFAAEHYQGVQVNLYQKGQVEPEVASAFYDELERRLEARPEIESAALGRGVPWGWAPATELARDERDADAESWPSAPVLGVGEGFLETARLPLVAGSSIERTDGEDAQAVVSASFARRWLGGVGEAVGRRLTLREGDSRRAATVVGVVADVGMARLQEDPTADERIYLGDRFDRPGATVLLRSRGDDEAALAALEEEVKALDPLAAVYNPSDFSKDRAASSWEQRRLAQLLVVFGVASLLLCSAGLYSMVDLAGRRRRREFGLRLALGAVPGQVRRLVVREGALQLVSGVGLGVGILALVAPALRQFLVRATLWDPLALIVALALMVATVLLATAGPARRASRVDPARSLRSE